MLDESFIYLGKSSHSLPTLIVKTQKEDHWDCIHYYVLKTLIIKNQSFIFAISKILAHFCKAKGQDQVWYHYNF